VLERHSAISICDSLLKNHYRDCGVGGMLCWTAHMGSFSVLMNAICDVWSQVNHSVSLHFVNNT
jgi:hypothetical protein